MKPFNKAEQLFYEALQNIKENLYAEAEEKLKKSNILQPERKSIILNLSSVLIKLKKINEAKTVLDNAIAKNSEDLDYLLNKITILMIEKKFLEGIEILENINKINPEIAEVYAKLGSCYSSVGNIEKSIENYERSFDLDKNYKTLSSLIFCSNFKKDYSVDKNNELINKFDFFVPRTNKVSNFYNYKPNTKEINIGFISGDLRKDHPIGNIVYDFLKNLRNNFKLYAYYNNEEDNQITNDFKILFNKWENIEKSDDLNVTKKIRQDNIHVLVDLSGHTNKNRLPIFANKAAPLQITWSGYLNSTGVTEIDYIIGDPCVTPLTEKSKFSEKILQMPNIWNSFSVPQYNNLKINTETPMLKNKFITFGAFHQIKKINENVIKLWSKILLNTSHSLIIIRAPELDDKIIKDKLYNQFSIHGIDSSKLILEGSTSRENLLSEYNKIDIFLDTFPYNGGSTSFECAFMGVPMLTLKGNRFLSRCGESININLGMHEWIANDQEEYYKKAVKFNENVDNLNLIRKNLHSKAINSPLFDSKKFAKDFEIIIKNLLFTHLK
jgi:predicted O-linked N-acetylglucosamine transferase (SPINDLY family)